MARLQRVLTYSTAAITAVALGTFAPDRWILGFHGLLTIFGVAITGIVVRRSWHANDAPTRCGFVSMVAGLASIRVAMASS